MNNLPCQSELPCVAGPSSSDLAVSSSSVELKKDGSASKMRMHRGNLPSIPQNKLCPICPAKFTRTTHLNRHLRTHSGQRLHECNICHSQFTRSDLLTRHKRTCGDPESVPRSRRKSCQSCSESKVKCDLQQPCSKCTARNRDCIYINHVVATNGHSSQSHAAAPGDAFQQSSGSSSSGPTSEHVDSPVFTLNDEDQMNAALLEALHSGRLPTEFTAPAAFASPINFFVDSLSTFARIDRPDAHPQGPQSSLFSNEIFDDLLGGIFAPSQQQFAFPESASHSGSGFVPTSLANGGTLLDTQVLFWHETLGPRNAAIPPDSLEAVSSHCPKPVQVSVVGAPPVQELSVEDMLNSSTGGSSSSAFNHDLCLFFSTFLKMLPIVHTPTFQVAGKQPILVTAMRACGALYVRSRAATTFITAALDSARDELFAELAGDTKDWEYQIHLVLAVALLQTIGLFHQLPEQRASSNVYHGMLIMLIRMSGFVQQCASWVPPDVIAAASAEDAWRDWAMHETAKRAMLLLYAHDCCHCIYYNLRPTFPAGEFELGLPCEDALWAARSADEWRSVLLQPSPYGSAPERLAGRSLQRTLAHFAEPRPALAPPPVLNPHALFIVIHGIMRTLFEGFLDACPPEPGVAPAPMGCDALFALQRTLQRWLQSWLASPESPPADAGARADSEEPPFLFQALPFYWLAQVAILAYQEGLPPFGPGAAAFARGDAKFRLMKKWERHIRAFLRKGQEPTLCLYKLMEMHIEESQVKVEGVEEDVEEENLLGFFGTFVHHG